MIKVYSTESCPWCVKAKQYLKSKNIEYKSLTVTVTNRYRQYLQGFQDIFCQFSTVTQPIPRKGQVKE